MAADEAAARSRSFEKGWRLILQNGWPEGMICSGSSIDRTRQLDQRLTLVVGLGDLVSRYKPVR